MKPRSHPHSGFGTHRTPPGARYSCWSCFHLFLGKTGYIKKNTTAIIAVIVIFEIVNTDGAEALDGGWGIYAGRNAAVTRTILAGAQLLHRLMRGPVRDASI